MSINLLLIQHVNRAKTLCNRIIKVCLMFAAGSLKQMDSLLELFVVFDSEDVHVYTVYFTNARVYKGSTALNGHVSKSITNLLVIKILFKHQHEPVPRSTYYCCYLAVIDL